MEIQKIVNEQLKLFTEKKCLDLFKEGEIKPPRLIKIKEGDEKKLIDVWLLWEDGFEKGYRIGYSEPYNGFLLISNDWSVSLYESLFKVLKGL